jgi:8-oxo-dGTP diphosphatase
MKIVAKALIQDNAGNVLLIRRSDTHPNFPHHIDFPGGEVELGESHADAVKREIREETGLDIPIEMLELAYSKMLSESLSHIVFTARVPQIKPKVELSWEHGNFEWMPFDAFVAIQLPESIDQYHLTMLEYANQTKYTA